MTKRSLAMTRLAPVNLVLLTVLFALTAFLVVSPTGAVPIPDDGNTEDVLYMTDGRVLHGQILEEKADAIVFQLTIKGSNIRTKVTYLKSEIEQIERGAEPADEAQTKTPAKKVRRATSRPDDEKEDTPTYGSRHGASDNENLPSFYIVPMEGQMGTDVNTDVYRDMVKDIRAHDPDYLVIKMKCADNEDVLYSLVGREEQGLPDFDEFRKLISVFRDDLGDIKQIMWVEDSVGVSSVVALVWEDLYMSPDARLGGLVALQEIGFEKWSDDDVRGKMTAAFMSWVKGFLEHGGYSLVLADAMVRPTFSLSGTWKGRDVIWTLDTSGDYIVDQDDKETAEFRAKSAEDLCLSDGTIENLDDLALLMGIREYRHADGKGEEIFTKYKEGWRRSLDNCVVWLQDYQQFLGWASGDETLKYLGQAKGRVEKVIAAMERYSAVETRLKMEHGVNKFDLITIVEQLKEQIRSIKQAERPRRGGRGG